MVSSQNCVPHLLIVDDDPAWARILLIALETQAVVTWARSLGEARALLREHVFELVIADLQLGPESGCSLLEAARRFNPSTRVLILSGHSAVQKIASELRADHCLSKPVRLKDLGQVVHDLLAMDRKVRDGLRVDQLRWASPDQRSDHSMIAYESMEQRLGHASEFLVEGLRRGERCIAVVERERIGAFKSYLHRASPADAGKHLEQDVLLVEAETVCERLLQGGTLCRGDFRGLASEILRPATDPATRGIRFYGEGVGALMKRGFHRAAVQLEGLWNEILPPTRMRMLCGFMQKQFDKDACPCLHELTGQHDACIRHG